MLSWSLLHSQNGECTNTGLNTLVMSSSRARCERVKLSSRLVSGMDELMVKGTGSRFQTLHNQSVLPHSGFEWHSLLSNAPEFPPVKLALYPSPPPLDPSCTLSTGQEKNRETGTRAGQARPEHTDSEYKAQRARPQQLNL